MATPAKGVVGRQLRRDVSPLGLMFVSLGSIIGSGWLFGALYASQIAGLAAIIAWVAGGLVMLLLPQPRPQGERQRVGLGLQLLRPARQRRLW